MTVTLDGLAFESEPDDGQQSAWKLTDLVGWYSGPGINTQITSLPNADGAFAPYRTYRTSRSLSLEGFVYGYSQADAIALAWNAIAAIGSDGQDMTLQVTDETGDYTCQVWLAGGPQVLPFAPGRAKFQVPLVAVDPRKYASPPHEVFVSARGTATDGLHFPLGDVSQGYLNFGAFAASGTSYIKNGGTATTWPLFVVRGHVDAAGFTIVSAGDTLTFAGGIAQGSTVTLSPYAGGRASNQDGQDVTPYMTALNWPSIQPGETREFQFIALGAAAQSSGMTVISADAFW